MRPPPVFLLQCLNALVAFSLYLTLKLGTSTWTAAGWHASSIGLAVTLATLTYGLLVSVGGTLADRHGRAFISSIGGAIGVIGCLLPLVHPHPISSAIAVVMAFLASAFFFPGIAGLFSDSGASQKRELRPPLHRRVSQYNLGWSLGNVLGLVAAIPLGACSSRVGYAVALAGFVLATLLLQPYRRLPALVPAADGDRTNHPALAGLTLMGRISLLLACLVGFSLVSQMDKALAGDLPPAEASHRASIALASYCSGYFVMFALLGRWSGWVLRPWRLYALQVGLLLGPVGLLVCGLLHHHETLTIATCMAIIGIGYGAAYTSSIYYSLRLPTGASHAAGLHETFLGIGNTAGPVICGLFSDSARGLGPLATIAAVTGVIAVGSAIYQGVMIPRLLARFP